MAMAAPLAVEAGVAASPIVAAEAATIGGLTAQELGGAIAAGIAGTRPAEKGIKATIKETKSVVKDVKDVVGLGSTLYHGGHKMYDKAGSMFSHHKDKGHMMNTGVVTPPLHMDAMKKPGQIDLTKVRKTRPE